MGAEHCREHDRGCNPVMFECCDGLVCELTHDFLVARCKEAPRITAQSPPLLPLLAVGEHCREHDRGCNPVMFECCDGLVCEPTHDFLVARCKEAPRITAQSPPLLAVAEHCREHDRGCNPVMFECCDGLVC